MVLLMLAIAGTLINVPLFIYPSLGNYFLFTFSAAVIVLVAGLSRSAIAGTSRTYLSPAIFVFLLWGLYILIHGLFILGSWNLWYSYLISGCLLALALDSITPNLLSLAPRVYTLVFLFAVIESLICFLQWAGILVSSNPFFHVTGTWTNPNVTAIFLALAAPAALYLQFNGKKRWRYLLLSAFILILVALVLLRCRTAMAGAVLALGIQLGAKYDLPARLNERIRGTTRIVILPLTVLLLFFLSSCVYLSKKDSADGRLMIWKLSMSMIAQRPLTGCGYGLFERSYNLQQAEYFGSGAGSPREKANADHVYSAYNEFIQSIVEGGIPGLLCFALLFFVLFRFGSMVSGSSTEITRAALSGCAAFALMSLFNFTIQAMPAYLVFILYAVITLQSRAKRRVSIDRRIMGGFFMASGLVLLVFQGQLAQAYYQVKEAVVAEKNGNNQEAEALLKPLQNLLSTSDTYWQTYAATLFLSGRYAEATPLLERQKELAADPDTYLREGYCLQHLKKYTAAEAQFRMAKSILPGRLTPRYALMRLYTDEGDTTRALASAREILTIQPKTHSRTEEKYKAEADCIASAYPPEVETVLKKAGKNSAELEKAIAYFKKSGDLQKLKAIYFLVGNMDIHFSQSYYWSNGKGERIPFNELEYPDFKTATAAFEKIKQRSGPLHAVRIRYNDMDTITSGFLIRNVEQAFSCWKQQLHPCSFDDFCEYILPYRVHSEPLQEWREAYRKQFTSMLRAGLPADSLMLRIGQYIRQSFSNTYGVRKRPDPLPLLGPMQLLLRSEGDCDDISDLTSFIARSNGIPASVDFVPAWATATGNHFMNFMEVGSFPKHHLDAADDRIVDSLPREPAKVLRTTFSKQSNTAIANADTADIPPGYLRRWDYKDVTAEYWPTGNLPVQLFGLKTGDPRLVYAAVWNGGNWRPVWWGKIENGRALLTNMCTGVIYLPMYYVHGKMIPAGWPAALTSEGVTPLKANTLNTRSISLREQARYLLFRPGVKYTLYYWDKVWIKTGEQVAGDKTLELKFDKVPANALLLLNPEHPSGKERPFVVDARGNRSWF